METGIVTKEDAQKQLAGNINDLEFANRAERSLLDLGTRDVDVFQLMKEAISGENASTGKTLYLQYLLQKRSEIMEALSNTAKKMHDTARSIIANFR